jgi:hypothetical protein
MKRAVAFATLFLGLTVGPHPVELLVGHGVDYVDLLVDGVPVQRMTAEPWTEVCDLGATLEPHLLEAVAYDAAGEELGRATQRLNLPRPPAQAEILLDPDPVTNQLIARLRANSIASAAPESVHVLFDGLPVDAERPDAIPLPPHDPEQLHYLRIEVRFADGLSSVVERTFGGSFVDEVDTELTAVALELDKKALEPSPSATGWLQAGDNDLTVVDIVTGSANIILIRDHSAQRDIDRMARQAPSSFRAVASLKRGYTFQIMPPVAQRSPRLDMEMHLFKASSAFTVRDGGVFWLLTFLRSPRISPENQQLSDALAVAGVSIAAAGNRRAAVLLLGPEPSDNSRFSAQEVRQFLEKLHVPLQVWSTTGERSTPWGPAADASSMNRLERRTRKLVESVERQRIAWVRGVHLPSEITLASEVGGIRLAGS